jgi:hypothetical protein
LAFLAFAIAVELGTVLTLGINRAPHNDESPYLATMQLFGSGITIDMLRTYNEISTPLPFIVYGFAGRLVGYDISHLRVISLVIALVTYVLFFELVLAITGNALTAFLTSAFLALHPYMVAVSFTIYTDILTILFLVVAMIAVVRRSPWLLFAGSAGSLLCRQYALFLSGAAVIFFAWSYAVTRQRNARDMLIASAASLLPLIALFALWRGLSPDSARKYTYMANSEVYFHPNWITLYVTMLFSWMLPLLAFRVRQFYRRLPILLVSLALSPLYWLFPIRVSRFVELGGGKTVGFLNSALLRVLKTPILVHVVFFIFFLLALPILLTFLLDALRAARVRRLSLNAMLDLTIPAFLVTMAFSHHCWEKYFLLVLPLAAIRILQEGAASEPWVYMPESQRAG